MSHVVKIETKIRDAAAVAAASRRLGLAEPVEETVRLFSSQVKGLAVRLPNRRYPIVCDLASARCSTTTTAGSGASQGNRVSVNPCGKTR